MLRQEHVLSTIHSTTTPAVDSLDGADVDDQGMSFLHSILGYIVIRYVAMD